MDIEIGAKIGSGSFGTVYKAKWHGKCLESLSTNNITSTALSFYVHVFEYTKNWIHMLHKETLLTFEEADKATTSLIFRNVVVYIQCIYTTTWCHSVQYFSCLMKVITASSKRCNKVCEQFEQCMSGYQTGYNNR